MTRSTLSFLALALAASVTASAQSINAPVGVSEAAGSAAAAAGAAARGTVLPSMTIPSLAPSLSVSAAPSISAVMAAPAASPAAVSALAPAAPAALAAVPVRAAAADGPTPLQLSHGTGNEEMVHDGPRGRNLVSIREFEGPQTPDGWETSRSLSARTFDGTAARKALDSGEAPAVTGSEGRGAPALAKPAVKAARRIPLAAKVLTGLALALIPGAALAAAPVAAAAASPVVFSVGGTLSVLAALRPAASAIGAVAGAVYGMFAARPQDGSQASAGDTFTSVLHYGALGGAAVYMLLDVTQLAFVGPSAAGGLQPLSSAVVTAALGRTAFQGKFKDPATTSADRIVGAFPAVAAALGISLGVVGFVSAPPLAALAMGAMTITGVATALYAAIFKLGRSPLAGPALMAKGYVLQALMTGMALAVANPYLTWIFAAMGAAGFALVLWTMGRELISFLPGHAEPAPPPAPAPKA